jgi:(R,R)-butanediol dehydrogenase/meso-butanediol dehydrogenase/diacetyl reductase
MRAAVFKEMSKPLVIETVPDPICGPHDLILKVRNCGICGSDLHMTEPTSALPLAPGNIRGHEFAGEIVEVGKSVTHLWKTGQRVAGFPVICCGDHIPCINHGLRGTCMKMLSVGLGQSPGAYADFVRIGAASGYRLPENVSYRDGAMVEPLAVGLHAVDMAKMPRGATVLVIGAGPVGLATMLWANFLGARHVIVSERAEVRQKMASRFGATDAIDASQPLTPQVEKIAGKAPDVIFECVGVPGLIGQSMT